MTTRIVKKEENKIKVNKMNLINLTEILSMLPFRKQYN